MRGETIWNNILIECWGDRLKCEAAGELDISPQMLGMIKRGDRGLSMKLARKTSEYYKMSIEEIFLVKSETIRL